MAKNMQDDAMLEALFAEAAEDMQAAPSPDLLARVLADAETMLPQPTVLAVALAEAPPRVGVLRQLLQAIGGWPSLAGLATATVAGVWIGFSASTTLLPDGVAGLIEDDSATYLAYIGTDYALAAEEG